MDPVKIKDNFYYYDVTQLAEGLVIIAKDHWWLCVDGDPKKAVFWSRDKIINICKMRAQCNQDKRIVEHLKQRFGMYDDFHIVQIPAACYPTSYD